MPPSPRESVFYSQMFLVPKKSGGFRPIFNARPLNQYIEVEHFKMEGLHVARLLLRKDDWLYKVDLKDAFFHIAIRPDLRDWLRFHWQGVHYRFRALPFGLCVSPRTFTKVLREALLQPRARGLRLVQYADDILGMASSRRQAETDLAYLRGFLEDKGFLINLKDSVLIPTQALVFLGFLLDTRDFALYLPKDKLRALQRLVRASAKRSSLSPRELASLVGKLLATARAVSPASLFCGPLSDLQAEFARARVGWDIQVPISRSIRCHIAWWVSFLEDWNGTAILLPSKTPDVVVFTDASDSGWGASTHNAAAWGSWTLQQAAQHINIKELLAVLLGLESFVKLVSHKTVLIRTDSIVAMAYVNRMAGRKPRLRAVTQRLFRFCNEQELVLIAEHIPGIDNVRADTLSRKIDPSDWKLHPDVFAQIDRLWGPHDIDLFATANNKQLPIFFSWCHQPGSAGVDAFLQKWGSFRSPYANPPFAIIPRVLNYLRGNHVPTITMVIPFWQTQPWWPDMLSLLVARPRALPCRSDLYLPASLGNQQAMGPPRWSSIVIRASGDPSKHKVFLRNLLVQLSPTLRRRRRLVISPLGLTSHHGRTTNRVYPRLSWWPTSWHTSELKV